MPGFFFSWSPCSVDGSCSWAATSVWHSTQRSAMVAVCQKKAWQAEHLPLSSAWEVTPPRVCTGLGVERTWTEKHPTADQPHPDHNQYSQQGCDQVRERSSSRVAFFPSSHL